eukprot:CAMPEP_0196727272 /NCGR_PEP_ID=MMETSP1091-20130531/8299_1 /TAXON_ID=302021 /ORGANISM="Rhodomonas sp., Strain CCMP768" /LENGTH=221 /DNA_ID=CAMNT_0042069835 /DNA_START=43 /DNA_END=708 /DNA_ORIENTATION=+
MSAPCCGRDRLEREHPSVPLRRITALQDSRVHFINDAPMMCIMRQRLWEQRDGTHVIRDINGISLFQIDGLLTATRQLLLPNNGGCHAKIERGPAEDEWSIYVQDERRVTVLRRVVGNQAVFLVHVLSEPFPQRGSPSTLPLPALSVRGNFKELDFWMYDCSDPNNRKVAHASRGVPSTASLQGDKSSYTLEVAEGLDVALVICVALVVDDSFAAGAGANV